MGLFNITSYNQFVQTPHFVYAATMTASRINVACQAKDTGSSAGLEELTSESSKKKERLSRKERTALVESFVLK